MTPGLDWASPDPTQEPYSVSPGSSSGAGSGAKEKGPSFLVSHLFYTRRRTLKQFAVKKSLIDYPK